MVLDLSTTRGTAPLRSCERGVRTRGGSRSSGHRSLHAYQRSVENAVSRYDGAVHCWTHLARRPPGLRAARYDGCTYPPNRDIPFCRARRADPHSTCGASLVRLLERGHVPSSLAVVAVVVIAFGIIFAMGSLLAAQVNQLAADLPSYRSTLSDKIKSVRGMTGGSSTLEAPVRSLARLG